MKRLVNYLSAAAISFGVAGAAHAQSTFGCQDLDGFHALPSVEGQDGVFYRVEPELYTFHAFSDETVEDVARLAKALADSGTTLVYVPVPPKSMVLTRQLPQRAYDYGFDPAMATTVYNDMVDRLREAGVVTVNLRNALVVGSTGYEIPYFKADFRLNTYGARLTARAITQELAQTQGFNQLPRSGFTSTSQGVQEVKSDMRNILQRHCLIELPRTEVEVFATGGRGGAGAVNTQPGTTVFGGRSMGSHIALVGTEYSSEPMINMAGFLSEMTGAAVENRAIQDGGAFASITTYLTSQEYQQNRPVFLVWENPVYNNLAQFGDQPMKELMATAGNSCRVPIPVMASLDSNRIQADLSTLDPSQNYTLMIETDGVAATAARFTFTSPTGDTRTKSVNRRSAAEASDRFFVPVSGLWREGIRSLEIELNAAFGSSPRISACFN